MASRSRRQRRRFILIGAVVVFLLAASSLSRFYTDVLWFQEVGFESILWKSIGTQVLVGAAVAAVVAAIVWVNLVIAARVAPAYG
ncbi:MAG: UPF0182 family protein, partial [Actinomycetota bacterium]|nr:UPF0182 family protein [Actinomycetota bacterium]